MADRSAAPPAERPPRAVLATLAVAVLGLGGLVSVVAPAAWRRYCGPLEPHVGIAVIAVAAPALVWLLARRADLPVLRRGTVARDLALAALLAAPFIAAVIVLDRLARFPADINVPLPQALAFYPFIACVVETVFHLAPLALLLTAGRAVTRASLTNPAVWSCFVAVAALEPAFQLAIGTWDAPWGAHAYLAVHLFAFDLVQLGLYRRRGFLPMLAFRLAYRLAHRVGSAPPRAAVHAEPVVDAAGSSATIRTRMAHAYLPPASASTGGKSRPTSSSIASNGSIRATAESS
ncbi:MAG: hypothetical protein KC619_17685 [Myxococcales bacterium]|nr:hypothetical protein [Myxococcales bacterium]